MNKNYITTLSKNGIKIEHRKPMCLKTFMVNATIIFSLLILGGILMSVGNGNINKYCDYTIYPQHQGELNCIFK